MLYKIQNSKDFSLNENYTKLFGWRCKLATVLSLIASYTTTIITSLVIGSVVTISYFDTYINHSLILTIIWYINALTVATFIPALLFTYAVYIYIFTLYIKFRFKQVLDLIAVYHKNSKSFLNQFNVKIGKYVNIVK
jgi:hypothetical protein